MKTIQFNANNILCGNNYPIAYYYPIAKDLVIYTWDEEKDGPIPGIKLFKDLNIFLEREYCEY